MADNQHDPLGQDIKRTLQAAPMPVLAPDFADRVLAAALTQEHRQYAPVSMHRAPAISVWHGFLAITIFVSGIGSSFFVQHTGRGLAKAIHGHSQSFFYPDPVGQNS